MRDRKSDKHRPALERKLGRKLGTDEVVHHGNEDKADNSDANLSVESRAGHTARHNRTRHVSDLRKSLRMAREQRKLY